MFGLWDQAPEKGPAWGARAIFSDGYVDLLHDRQDRREMDKEFAGRINRLLPEAKKQAKSLMYTSLAPSAREVVTLAEGEGIVIKASTRASYGYLYLIAYPV